MKKNGAEIVGIGEYCGDGPSGDSGDLAGGRYRGCIDGSTDGGN